MNDICKILAESAAWPKGNSTTRRPFSIQSGCATHSSFYDIYEILILIEIFILIEGNDKSTNE